MPSGQDESKTRNDVLNREINAVLIEVLAEELRYRYRRAIEQWNRDNPWWSRGWTKCPLSKELVKFESEYSAAKDNTQALVIVNSTRALKKIQPQFSGFHDSVKVIFLRRNILKLANANEPGKQEDVMSDPVVKTCWDVLEGTISARSKRQAETSKTTEDAAPEQEVQNITPEKELISILHEEMLKLYNLTLNENFFAEVKNKTRKGWNWFFSLESSEEKAVKSIEKESLKYSKHFSPDMVTVGRQLKILSDEIAKRTKKTDHIEAISNIHEVFVEMYLLSKIERIIEIQPEPELTYKQQHAFNTLEKIAEDFQHRSYFLGTEDCRQGFLTQFKEYFFSPYYQNVNPFTLAAYHLLSQRNRREYTSKEEADAFGEVFEKFFEKFNAILNALDNAISNKEKEMPDLTGLMRECVNLDSPKPFRLCALFDQANVIFKASKTDAQSVSDVVPSAPKQPADTSKTVVASKGKSLLATWASYWREESDASKKTFSQKKKTDSPVMWM